MSGPVTATDAAISDHVVIECPACGASEAADPAVLADDPDMVCRECGETWPSAPKRTKRRMMLIESAEADPGDDVIDAERRPLVTYSDGADKAWAAKMAGDYWPEPPRQWRFPMIAAAMAAMFFLAAFFGGREAAVAAIPDLAGLYAAIGLPVNLNGLAIEDVAAERQPARNGDAVVISGSIRNIGAAEQKVPSLAAGFGDQTPAADGMLAFAPPLESIAAGATIAFRLTLDKPQNGADEVIVRFQRHDETLPLGGTANSGEK